MTNKGRRRVHIAGIVVLCTFVANWFLRPIRGRELEVPGKMPTHPNLQAHLVVARSLTRFTATLTLRNTSAAPAHIVSWNVPNRHDDLENNVFEVVPEGGEALRYRGKKSKRLPPEGNDFLVLPAGAERTFEADLSAFYDVPTTGKVTIWYEAYHDIPGRDDDIFLVKSNAVEI